MKYIIAWSTPDLIVAGERAGRCLGSGFLEAELETQRLEVHGVYGEGLLPVGGGVEKSKRWGHNGLDLKVLCVS